MAARPGLGQKPLGWPPRKAARPPRNSLQARPEQPAGPVWRDNPFLTTTAATQLGRGLSDGGCTEIQG